jgi:DNA-binding NtrC family response regulator
MHALLPLGSAICAETIGQATELLAVQRWRLAIIDVILPGRSGVEIAAEAVAMGTPVVLTTGDFRAAAKLRRYGFSVLQKPMAMDLLVAESRMAINQAGSVCRAFGRSASRILKSEGSLWC